MDIYYVFPYKTPSPISETLYAKDKNFGEIIIKLNKEKYKSEYTYYSENKNLKNSPEIIVIKKIKNYSVLAMNYCNGKNLDDSINSDEILEKVLYAYKTWGNSVKNNVFLEENIHFTDEYILNWYKLSNKQLSKNFRLELCHKDFCPHNLILNENVTILDFQLISYGYKIEDIFQLYESIKFSEKTSIGSVQVFWQKVIDIMEWDITVEQLSSLLAYVEIKNIITLYNHFLDVSLNEDQSDLTQYSEIFSRDKYFVESLVRENIDQIVRDKLQ